MRLRALAATAAVATLVGACSSADSSNTTRRATTTSRSTGPPVVSTTTTTRAPAHLVIERASFSLPRPSARAVLVPQGKQLLVLGGLDGTRRTTNEIIGIDPVARAATRAGVLAVAVHDAADATVGGSPMVFGGGNATETAAVQRVASDETTAVVGQLPVPRSDVAAASVGDRTYLIGGFDGTQLRPTVIATTDGRSFVALGDLPDPVRYAAVAALGTNIYVVGGTTTGDASGAVRSVQVVDTT